MQRCIACIIQLIFLVPPSAAWAFESTEMLTIAHGGGYENGPANSLEAIRKTIARGGVNLIEVDIRITKDQIPITVHDDELSHTTDGSGLISQMTYTELKKYLRSNGEPIPRFVEVLKLCFEANIGVVLDFKTLNAIPAAVEALRDVLAQYDQDAAVGDFASAYHRRQVLAVFWDAESILALREHDRLLPTSMMLRPLGSQAPSYKERIRAAAQQFPDRQTFVGINLWFKAATDNLRAFVHEQGLMLGLGWPAEQSDIDLAASYQPDAIVTGFPSRVLL